MLFAKAPRRGKVKTRLAPPLSEDQALALHVAMLEDQIAFLRSLDGPGRAVEVCMDGAWSCDALGDTPLARQGRGDLGARLGRAIARGCESGARRVAILGGDAPTVPAARVLEAWDLLHRADAAVIPARDGGYVLLAARRPVPALLSGVPWGTGRVLAFTRRKAHEAGLVLAETAPWGDVDEPADLPRLAREVRADPARAPKTADLLARWSLDAREDRVV